MQATPTSSTFKLTTTASTTATNLHNLDTTTTGNNNIKVTKSTKINRNTTLNNNESCAASKEIEEISKKISEHADAIYRTWKCRGLAPTEILDIYTNVVEHNVTTEAADIFGGSVEAAAAVVGTTEGLQKLVNQFVIKDKEQRGVKPSTVTSSTAIYGTGVNLNKSQRTEAITTETKIMPENIGSNKMTQKTGNSNHSIGVGGNLKQSTSKTTTTMTTATATATGIQQKPSTTKTTTSTSSAILLKSSNSNENSSVKKLAKSAGVTTSKTASSTALSSSSTALSSSSSSLSTVATSLKNNACVKNVNSAQQQHNNNKPLSLTTTQTPTSTASTTPTTTKTPTTKRKGNSAPTLDINLNLDLGFDPLQLDVNSLSQLQTQNLLKIKELLHDNSTTAAATTTTTKTTTTTTQQPKKTITTTTATKTSNKIKRAISPAKLQESTTVTDSPIVTKTKLSKVVNENDQINNNNNNVSVKKIAKNANNNSISDKSNSNSKLNNGNDCIVGAVDAINDAVISKLINTNDRLTSGKTTTTKAKSNATTKSIIAKTTKTPAIITPMPTTTADTAVAAAAAAAAAAMPISANVVGSVKTVDHQSIKSGGNSTNGSFTKNQPHAAALNDNVGQQLTIQKPTTPTIKKVIAKESKINDSEAKININNSNNSNSNNNNNVKVVNSSSSNTVKPHKSVKSTSSPKATTQTVVASSKTANPMEIAPESKDKINSNNNSNGNDNSNNNGSDNSSSSNNMPAPTKLSSGRAALGASQDKLNRPFLTRGSVAERVLMFEKCPDVRNSYLNIKRPDLDVLPKSLRKVSVKLHSTPPGNQKTEQNSLQKEIRTTRSVYIPRFYFPHGKPQPQIAQERTIRGILSAFDSFPNNQVTKDELPQILKICGLPFYWRMPVVVFCQQHNSGLVERSRFLEFWKQMNIYCHDSASRFVYIHSRGQRFRSYIAPEDLVPLVQDVVDTHPGLAFLKEATEFHSRYVHTVIARIFYSVNRSWSGKITISELKKSDLLEIIQLLEEEDDINQIMAFFSYEHFYVIYCKFWELDKDHDLLINQDDLARHSDHALSTRIVERIFSGCVTRNDNKKHPNDEPKMSYTDFVWFLLSEEDKRTPTAIEYWFRCMDLDGDGFLSMYELEYFYEEQQQRMESIGIETLPFEDCLCQMLDMIKPQNRDAISLGDLKRCRMTQVFFDTFFNLEKYLDHEQRDPFATQRDEYSSDWDRFAAHEYELLISEENG